MNEINPPNRLRKVISWVREKLFPFKLSMLENEKNKLGNCKGKVFAPRDCYQDRQLLERCLIKAGVPSIEKVWHEAKKEHRLWIFPI